MDIDKKIEMLRKRNAMLQEENEALKAQLSQQNQGEDRYKNLCEQLEDLKARWENEVSEIRSQRIKYEALIGDVKKVKDILVGK